MDGEQNEPATPWEFKPAEQAPPAAQVGPDLNGTEGVSSVPVDAPPAEPVSQPAALPPEPAADTPGASAADQVVTWTASEFIAHHKTASWYLGLAGVAVVAAGIIWLLTRDTISAAAVCVGAVFLGIYAGRQPRQLPYRVDMYGVAIGQRQLPYEQFRSFAVVHESALPSIVLLPLKRFAPLITIYFDPADEPRIVELLSNYLPLEEHQLDLMDRFLSRIRF